MPSIAATSWAVINSLMGRTYAWCLRRLFRCAGMRPAPASWRSHFQAEVLSAARAASRAGEDLRRSRRSHAVSTAASACCAIWRAGRPERRRPLRATIGWTYELLFRDDRRGLWALATFAGGATLPA